MKILVINGSPKVESSNTLKLTNAFLKGLQLKTSCQVTFFSSYESKNINACTGCYTCWTKTPGKCIYNDDMPLNDYIEADLIIWSFPLYYYSMPSKVKCVMDRLLPLVKPIIQIDGENKFSHPARYDFSNKKILLISTCGFCEIESNYSALLRQFDLVYKGDYLSIICSEGELFRAEQVKDRCDEYLIHVKKQVKSLLNQKKSLIRRSSYLVKNYFLPKFF